MKITYKYGQEFELKEIDSMGNFEPTFSLKLTVDFEIPFSHIMELQNIPKLLNDYLKENDLLD